MLLRQSLYFGGSSSILVFHWLHKQIQRAALLQCSKSSNIRKSTGEKGREKGQPCLLCEAKLSLCSFNGRSYLPLHQASATPYQTLQCWERPWGDTKKGEEVRDLGYFSWALRLKGSLGKVFAAGSGSLMMSALGACFARENISVNYIYELMSQL